MTKPQHPAAPAPLRAAPAVAAAPDDAPPPNPPPVVRRASGRGPNCLLGVCCPPGGPAAQSALAEQIAHDLGWDASKTDTTTGNARVIAEWILDHYDLAPHGTLRELFSQIAALAREQ